MNLNNLADCHTHTNFSPDGENTPEEMCKRAMDMGLSAYAITDHCDCNYWYSAEHYFPDKSQADDIIMYGAGEYANKSISVQMGLKEKYGNRINLICGIELGQPLQNIEKAEEIVSNTDIDFIIGSHHQNRNEQDFYFLKYKKMDLSYIYTLIDEYFDEMLEMCQWGKFDVLGHLTYPLRYIHGDCGIELDLTRYNDIIREIFCTLINNGKGIEINTSGLRQKYGKTFPDVFYLKLYHELGGRILSIGSDSHRVEDLGKGILDGIELAKQAGFEYLSFFKKHSPQLIKI